MTGPTSVAALRQAEQRSFATELALLRAIARATLYEGTDGTDDLEAAHRAVEEARAATTVPPALDRLAEAFDLTPFERRLLVLAAGAEMDDELAAASAAVRGRTGGSRASFALARALWPDADWEALSPSGPLRRWHLVEMDPGPVLAQSPLRVPERVLHHLVGVEAQDPQLATVLRPRGPSALMTEGHRTTALGLVEAWEPSERGWPVVQLCGDDRDGQEDVAAAVTAELGWGLAVVAAEDVPTAPEDRWTFAALWTRESLLSGAALYVDGHGGTGPEAAVAVVDAMAAPVLVGCPEPVRTRRASLVHRVGLPDRVERRELWRAAVAPADPKGSDRVAELACGLRMSARAIERSAPGVGARLAAGADPLPLLRHAVAPTGHGLDDLAERIEPMASWRDLVATPQLVATLREIAAQVRHRSTVYESWGFAGRSARGLGITALFTGESGTGKTMAAEVLADELSLDLYRIDLSAVVSKYIGETEKNLRRVFDAAEETGAILLFDEADALFGRRSEVKDSHDRYANIEVSYLLQRMEAYRGLAILTTNMRSALDKAFQRRLRFAVQFPFPDAKSRERIWRGVFPRQTPVDGLDRKQLAQLSIAGGSIRSIAVNAAFRAAASGGPVTMRHVQDATHGELAKLERSPTAVEGQRW